MVAICSKLKRTYKAFMNYYYLKAAYDLGVGNETSAPPEVITVIRASKFYDLLSDEGSGDTTVNTQKDLDQFVADLNDVAALYKKRLSQEVFNSPTYKASLKAINKDKRGLVRYQSSIDVFSSMSAHGSAKDIKKKTGGRDSRPPGVLNRTTQHQD
jgi:ABC-type hemin transport system substrate-binding protein